MRLVFLLLSPAMFLSAQSGCPWLNAGTAGGLLGGVAKASVIQNPANREDGTCTFTVERESIVSTLKIEVETLAAPAQFASWKARCGSDAVPLKANGNEASACRAAAGRNLIAEQVIGRVRTRAFAIRVTTSEVTADRKALREKARSIAEQVAGSLF